MTRGRSTTVALQVFRSYINDALVDAILSFVRDYEQSWTFTSSGTRACPFDLIASHRQIMAEQGVLGFNKDRSAFWSVIFLFIIFPFYLDIGWSYQSRSSIDL